jgi:ELWxxDGT repeat protein
VDLRAAHITPVRAWKDQFYFELSVERVTDAGYQQITYRPEPNSTMMTRQLWRTDGKPAGTYRVPAPTDGGKEVYYAGTLNLSRHGYDGFMGKMHFGDLAMDPETEQFSAVSFYDIAWRRQLVGDKLFFYGTDSRPADGSGFVAALWVSDGTVAGTQLVKRPGSASGTTANIGVTSLSDFDTRSSLSNELGGILNNKLVMSLDIKKAGRDDRYPSILVTDGTLDGTRVLKEIID